MKKIFGFGGRKGQAPSGAAASPRRDSGARPAGYVVRDKDLGKLHQAAWAGDVAKLQRLLLLKKRDLSEPDRESRTPLHLACANGYPDVVTLLVERKCQLNLYDNESRTPLIKAVQCQQEECTTILLEHGADPHLGDSNNNTALHYAASGQNIAIVAKLLKFKSEIEAKNKDGYTPLLIAIAEHNQDMVDFLLKNGANANAMDKNKRTALMIAVSGDPTGIVSLLLQYDVDLSCQDIYGWTAEEYAIVSGFPVHRHLINQCILQRELNQSSPRISSANKVYDTGFTLGGPAMDKEEIQESPVQSSGARISGKVVEHSFPEDSISRLSDKPGADDSWPSTDEDDLDFGTKKLPKSNLTKIINASLKIKKNIDEKSSIVNTEHRTCIEHSQSDNEKEDVIDSLSKPSSQGQCSPHPAQPLSGSFAKPFQETSAVLHVDKVESEEEEKEDVVLIDHGPRKQKPQESPNILNELQTHSASGNYASRKDMMSALGLEEGEETESPWDSESASESLPKGSPRHISSTTNQSIRDSISMGQLEDYPERYPNLKPIQPTIEMKNSFTNQKVEKGVNEEYKSYLMEEFGLDDPDDIDAVSDWDSTTTSQKYECYRSSKDFNFNGNYPCKSLTTNHSGSTKFGTIPLKEDEAAETGVGSEPVPGFRAVSLIENSVPHNEPQLPLEKQEGKKDLTQELEFKGSSEESQESFDKSDQEQVEEEKIKNQCNEILTLEGNNGDTLTENHMIGKVNELVFVDSKQLGKEKENKIPEEEFPIMSASSSKESSATVCHLLKSNDCSINTKAVKSPQIYHWISENPGITSSFEKMHALTGTLFQSLDESSLNGRDHDEERPAKEKLNENNKDKVQMDADDLDDLTQSSDISTEDYDLTPSKHNIMLLIEKLNVDCKDSISLLKIQDAVLTYERSVELKKSRCTLLTGKVKSLEKKIIGLQEELSETREMKSQLERQKVEWERELCSLRFTLKQEEEKRLSAEMLFEKIRKQLRRKEEQYSKEMELKQQVELSLRTLDLELRTTKNILKQVEEERNDAQRQLSQEKSARASQERVLNNHLWKQKEREAAASKTSQSLEIPDNHENEKHLLHQNHTLQEEVAVLKLELEALKVKNQEKENQFAKENEILKEKKDELQKELKLNEEALRKITFQYSGQINVLTTENAMLNSKLENEIQNRDRLNTEIESYRSRLTSAIHDHEQSQTSKLDLEHTIQKERAQWLHLQDRLNFDLSSLRDNNGILSQELSKAESKINSLENELYQVRDSLREKTLSLESTQRELNQTQYKAKELQETIEMEKEKLNKYIVKQESIQERLAQIQSENMLLRQQLEDAQNKGIITEKVVSDAHVQFNDLFNKLRADNEKQVLMVEERNKDLLSECNHLREQICKYENEKAEREGTVRKLQQEIADSLKKQSMTEASLEVTSRYRNDLEDKKKQLQKEVDQFKSKLQESQEQHIQSQRSANELEDHIQKLEIENSRLEATVKQQESKIEKIQKTMLDSTSFDTEREELKKLIESKQCLENRLDQEMKRNGELQKDINGFKKLLKTTKKKLRLYERGDVYQGVLNQTHSQMDRQINWLKNKTEDLTLQLEAASSKCKQMESTNKSLQEELFYMKNLQKKCDKLEKNKRQLEEEVVNLKRHLEITKLEHSQVEQYKHEIEERARQEIVEKLKEVNLFLQTQAASQENLEQLRENNNVSIRNQMEHRIRDLESELSKMKNSHQDSTKAELERYKQLYSEELKIRKSLLSKLDRTNEWLAEVTAKLQDERQKNEKIQTLINSFTIGPVLEPPHLENLNTGIFLNRSLFPRGNLVYSTGNTMSENRMEAFFAKMLKELEKSITKELNEANAELESRSCRASPLGSTDESSSMPNLKQDPVSRATQEYLEILKKKYMI
ncbi:ankyrin repeat domain-containing protein 26 isoform X12 [Macrotis lagotis]|uniref:ankyrin repeat domain-containing protein 26 isoform X12 n=1 Tax=Macrotis lagotis TaxID=92651 RepID=UPI003D698D51